MDRSIYADYLLKYKHQTPAGALFFHSTIPGLKNGLRVLLPQLGMEFGDHSLVGQDATGFFYYDDLATVKTANGYVSGNTTNPKNGQLIAWVKFYIDDTVVAEFLGDDYFRIVAVAGMVLFKHAGSWRATSQERNVEAYIKKDENSGGITLDISHSIQKIGTLTTDDPILKAAEIPNIKGNFYYSSMEHISDGTQASYTNDRIAFYKNDASGPVFTGYFIPNGREQSSKLLGLDNGTELLLSGTTWVNTK